MTISVSAERATLDKIDSEVVDGKEIATAVETVLDRQFIEKYQNDWCWVGNRDTLTETRWYKVDREHQRLVKIADDSYLSLGIEDATGERWDCVGRIVKAGEVSL